MTDEKILLDKWFNKKISISIGWFMIIATLLLLCFFVINSTVNRNDSYRQDKDSTGLEIGSLIRKVKAELVKADMERVNNNESALFKLKDFQMEISFTVRSVNKGGAKMDYKFVTVEGSSETGNEKVQKLTLHWDAIPETIDTLWNKNDTGEIIVKPLIPLKKQL